MNDQITYTCDQNIAVIRIENPPVNALGELARRGLIEAIEKFETDDAAEAAIITGAGNIFSAGADIKEFSKPAVDPILTAVTQRFDAVRKPTIAAIHNSVFGGALELALSCHYRICDQNTQFGLTEVTFGIFPGGTGTQRLPRLIGVKKALEIIVNGTAFSADKAKELGVVDEISTHDLLSDAMEFAGSIIKNKPAFIKTCDPENGLGNSAETETALAEYRQLAGKKMRGQIAPLKAIESVEMGLTTPFSQAVINDQIVMAELKKGEQSQALRYAFFAERQAAKIPGIGKEIKARKIAAAGVIGAGTMGTGIAISLADAGIPVTLIEASEKALDRSSSTIAKTYDRMTSRGRISEQERERRIGLISKSTSYDTLSDVDLVIEAVFEEIELKKTIFAKLDETCRAGAILATNSSSLDLNVIAAATSRPQDVCGLHFFSPANVMKLLEVVRGEASADDVIASAMALAKNIGKVGVLSSVCSGYVANRSRQPFVQEAMFLAEDGASPEQIDRVLVEFGMPMGPLTVGDLSGTDISYSMRQSQKADWDPEARYPHLADQIVELGRHGRKTGQGWYRYEDGRRQAIPDPEFAAIADRFRADNNITPQTFSDTEILERCLLAAVNEGAHILEEGIALRASDIDTMWLNGFAFPRYRGGIMHFADQLGLRQVYDKICTFREAKGEQWKPSGLLKDLAEKDGHFADI
ncbi:MAG: 3-hydroxyacyl-CoA dehydrogenase NAD-binding domain-containing protein [Rhizobiaceae bacterium]